MSRRARFILILFVFIFTVSDASVADTEDLGIQDSTTTAVLLQRDIDGALPLHIIKRLGAPQASIMPENRVLKGGLPIYLARPRQLQFYAGNAYSPPFYSGFSTYIAGGRFWPPYNSLRPYGPGFHRHYGSYFSGSGPRLRGWDSALN